MPCDIFTGVASTNYSHGGRAFRSEQAFRSEREETFMKGMLMAVAVSGVLIGGVVDAYAFAWGGGRGGDSSGSSIQSDSTKGPNAVPEPSTLYAIGSGLALLGGAGWYIRRRK